MALKPPVIALAMSHGGLVSRTQLLDLGLSRHWVDREVRSQRLVPLRPGIYRVLEMTNHTDLLRAALLALPGATVSHQSAAHLLQFPSPPKLETTVTVHPRTTHVFPGVTVRRTADLTTEHTINASGMPATNLMRTVFDLAGILHEAQTDDLVENLILEGRLDLARLDEFVRPLCRKGKKGSTAVRAIIDRRILSGAPDATHLERLGLQILRSAGLPDPVLEYPAPWDSACRLDAAYPPQRLAIEWDSTAWHSSLQRMRGDRERDRAAALAGWALLRYTWHDVTERPTTIATEVAQLLAARTA